MLCHNFYFIFTSIFRNDVSSTASDPDDPSVESLDGNSSVKSRRPKRISSLRLANGKLSYIYDQKGSNNKEDIKINIDNQNAKEVECLIKQSSLPNEGEIVDYIVDCVKPKMNHKDSTGTKSPPLVTNKEQSGIWGERDDISLYGTPKEELGPGINEIRGPSSYMRNQLQALFQPSGKQIKSNIVQ